MRRKALPALVSVLLGLTVRSADLNSAVSGITTNDLLGHIQILASDEFGGRAPGSRGEELAVYYIANQFRLLDLEPGSPDGGWEQEVPLVGIRSQVSARVSKGSDVESWQFPQDLVGWSPRMQTNVNVPASELVFVGYGIVAPEYGWDDFKDIDVRGKTLVMLVNDPPIADPSNPGKLDDAMFRGRAMTYYGRWTYKFEVAAAKGAAAALVVHETGPAGYPWFVVVNSWGRENFDLKTPDRNTNEVAVAAWISLDRAKRLMAGSGLDLDSLKKAALRRDFRPVPLGASIQFEVTNSLREVRSRNVVGRLTGKHPQRRNEYVVYCAHWDHLGRDERLTGDQIFNGALDNATGVAALLEVAETFSTLPQRPDRTILFLAVTAEEQGLLGAKYYVEHPLYPLESTLAAINIDGANVAGRQRDIGVVGHGLNTLEDLLSRVASGQNRVVRPESEPEKGIYYRSDHFEFAKKGVPALFLDKIGDDIIGQPPGYGRQRRDEYREQDYHKVSDDVKSWWNLEGAVQDTQLMFLVGYDIAQGERWPEWKPGAEFKARREAALQKAGRTETPKSAAP